MDGREAMTLAGGSAPYYIHRGVTGSASGSATQFGGATLHTLPGFRSLSNPQAQAQAQVQAQAQAQAQAQPVVGSTFSTEPKVTSFCHNLNADVPSGAPNVEPVKKKRGRPRKYAPDGQVSLGLLPLPTKPKPSSALDGSSQKKRGRPPGSGRKQQLALLGEWMNSSAGFAFAPHVITIGIGEDIVSKMLLFSQQRPRVVCIMSGTGTISSVTLRQPATSTPSVTYEGRFEILCLSGSYLLSEDGGTRSRTGGISASLSTPDGHVIGGGVSALIAASPVQLVICTFVYGESKAKSKELASPKSNSNDSTPQLLDKSAALTSSPPSRNFTPGMSFWPGSRPSDPRMAHTDIDLMRG